MNKRMRGGGGGNVDVCACTGNGNRESGTKVHSTVNLYLVDCVLKKVFRYPAVHIHVHIHVHMYLLYNCI